MAYHFSAEKHGGQDLQVLQRMLSHYVLFEFFPIEVSEGSLAVGISIPLKAMDDPRFEDELEKVMRYLVLRQKFKVTDLYTGNPVLARNISGLARQISD